MAMTIRSAEARDSSGIAALLDQLGYPADIEDVAARVTWLEAPQSTLLIAGVARRMPFPT